MSDVPPIDSALGELRILDVFIDYDGPKLFLVENAVGQQSLGTFVDDDDDSETYLYSETDPDTVSRLKLGSVSLRDAILSTSRGEAWVVRRSLWGPPKDEVKAIAVHEIPMEWLPAARVGLHGSLGDAPSDYRTGTYSSKSLQFSARFPLKQSSLPTTFEICLRVDNRVLWPADESLEFGVVDAESLLAFLEANWAKLNLEEGLPDGLEISNLAHLSDTLGGSSTVDPGNPDNSFEVFRSSHDLAEMAPSMGFESVVLANQGAQSWVLTASQVLADDRAEVLGALEALAEDVAGYLAHPAVHSNPPVVQIWRAQLSTNPGLLTQIATGISAGVLLEIERASGVDDLWSQTNLNWDSELFAAARMSRRLDAQTIGPLLAKVLQVPLGASKVVDDWADRAIPVVDQDKPPYAQGYQLARWLRTELAAPTGLPFNLAAFYEDLGVAVDFIETDASIDALALWGPRRGPAVLVNHAGEHARGRAGRRSTLAHELAHILLDRRGALPVADVFGGVGVKAVESRAGAFAAELLLPQALAIGAYGGLSVGPARQTELTELVERLSAAFDVSKEIVAWQLRNSLHLTRFELEILRQYVRGGWHF